MAARVSRTAPGKAGDAFRTISEVADALDVQKHVLRFWEIKFPQLRPMKRGGGRRFYRPEDVELLYGIRQLLHGEGYTIRGVQKILRQQGVDLVKALGAALVPVGIAASGAQTPEQKPAERKSSARKAAAKPAVAASEPLMAMPMMRDAVDLAISELEVCRSILMDGSNYSDRAGPAASRRAD